MNQEIEVLKKRIDFEVKFCKDCKYYEQVNSKKRFFKKVTTDMCFHPEATGSTLYLIKGEKSYTPCITVRSVFSMCSTEATYFEPKEGGKK